MQIENIQYFITRDKVDFQGTGINIITFRDNLPKNSLV